MKKIYPVIISGLLAVTASAQQTNQTLPVHAPPSKTFQVDKSKLKSVHGTQKTNMAGTYWVNYGNTIDQVLGGGPGQSGPGALYSNYLNTDTLLKGNFGGTYAGIWINHIADLIDFLSPNYSTILGTAWDNTTTFSIDSVSVYYGYTRKVDPSISPADTLIFTFFQDNRTGTTSLIKNKFTGTTATSYNTDTISLRLPKYAYSTNSLNYTSKVVYKFPLTQADTADAVYAEKVFGLQVPYSIAANKLFLCTVTFKPGYTYTAGDTADNKNAFFFTSVEENGANTFPSYPDCNYQSATCDYNQSFLVPNSVRYNYNASGWNGLFIPTYAYTNTYHYEHHMISYRVTDPAVAIKENGKNSVFSLDQNIPNPFSGTSTIGYTLKSAAKSVKLEIMDFSGRLISSQSESNVKPGYSSFTVEASKLSRGVYFYSLNVDGNVVTKRMIVE